MKVVWFSTSDKVLLKDLLVKNGIAVMWFQESAQPVWNLYEVVFNYENAELNIIFPVEGKLREAFDLFITMFGADFLKFTKYIKPFNGDFPEKKLKIAFNRLLEEKGYLKVEDNKTDILDKGQDWKIKKKLELNLDEKLKKELLTNVEDFIKEMDDFLPRVEDNFPVESNELKNLIGNLKKYRISTNLYKLSENYKKGLVLAEKLYDKYFEYEQAKENKVLSVRILSDLEIVQEYKKYEKVKRATVLEKVNAKEFWFPWYEVLYYKLLGKFGLYLKLLYQGYAKKLQRKGWNLDSVLQFFQFLFIFLIVDYTLLIIYFKFSGVENKVLVSYLFLVYFAYFWFVVTLSKLFAEKSKLTGIVILLGGLALFPVFKNFFAIYI